jgi:uncharacterized protein YggE
MDVRTITVKGTGNMPVKPDRIVISMTIEAKRSDYARTLELATKMQDSLCEALVAIGRNIKALKMTKYNTQPQYEYYTVENESKRRFTGYSCTHGINIEFDMDMAMLSRTLTAIAGCSAAPGFNINFTVKDKQSVRMQLLKNAVRNAAEQAAVLANAAGVTLGAIQRIIYSWEEIRLYSNASMDMRFREEASSTYTPRMSVDPDDIEASDEVTVVWEIC